MRSGDVPTGVKIISILYYIGAGIFALSFLVLIVVGIALMVNPTLIDSIKDLPEYVMSSSTPGTYVLLMGVLVGLIGVLLFFIARGLCRGKLWSKILVIIFCVIGIVTGFLSVSKGNSSGFLNFLFSLVVGGYLLFHKEARSFFS
jgi:uncharacterized membrane protein